MLPNLTSEIHVITLSAPIDIYIVNLIKWIEDTIWRILKWHYNLFTSKELLFKSELSWQM